MPLMLPRPPRNVKYHPFPIFLIRYSIAATPAADKPHLTRFPAAAAVLGWSTKASTSKVLQVYQAVV